MRRILFSYLARAKQRSRGERARAYARARGRVQFERTQLRSAANDTSECLARVDGRDAEPGNGEWKEGVKPGGKAGSGTAGKRKTELFRRGSLHKARRGVFRETSEDYCATFLALVLDITRVVI